MLLAVRAAGIAGFAAAFVEADQRCAFLLTGGQFVMGERVTPRQPGLGFRIGPGPLGLRDPVLRGGPVHRGEQQQQARRRGEQATALHAR